MTNKKIPWWEPEIKELEKKIVLDVLNSNYINEGEVATKFEEELKKILGVKYAIATTSGTAAIFLALKSLEIGHGDEVIVPDMTFIATANAVSLCGAKPVLTDVETEKINICIDAIKKNINKKTKTIMPVHVTGSAADMDSIMQIARDHNLFVVEDAAEAFTSKYKGKNLGTIGDLGCFSFSPNKTITTGQGGAVVTNNEKLAVKIRKLKDQGRPVRGTGGDDIYDSIGYNFKFTNLQAALGLGQLNYLKTRTERMKEIYRIYSENLAGIKNLKIYPSEEGEVPQWTDAFTDKRNELVDYLASKNMGSRKYWLPLHTQLAYKLPDNNFPNSLRISPKSLWLPSAFTLTDDDVLQVCQEIKEFFKIK